MKTFVHTLSWLLIAIATCFTVVSHADDDQTGTTWSYTGNTGPQFWGNLDKSYQTCLTGKEQSPINILTTTRTNDNILTIHYHSTPFEVIDDGVTSLNVNGHRTIINDGHTLQVNIPMNGAAEFITLKDDEQDKDIKYRLIQFHFHTPSETLIRNYAFPVEIHFVHQSKNGQLAVVGVFLKEGRTNPAIQKLIDNLPDTKKQANYIKDSIDLSALIPVNKSYYNFPGSLTTPPCSESLQWFVMVNPVEASHEQIEKLKTALPSNNARPVQALNSRNVLLYLEPDKQSQ